MIKTLRITQEDDHQGMRTKKMTPDRQCDATTCGRDDVNVYVRPLGWLGVVIVDTEKRRGQEKDVCAGVTWGCEKEGEIE